MSDFDNSGINRKQSPSGDIIAGLIITIVVLVLAIVCILGYNFFTKTMELENKDLILWLIFMFIAAAISCFSDTIISLVSKKSREDRDTSIVQEIKIFLTEKTDGITDIFTEKAKKITDILTEKADEITSAVTLQQTDFVSSEQDDILDKLMNFCSKDGKKIERIRILAQDSHTFSKFFTEHFENIPFKCNKLEIMVHNPDVNENHPIINEWMQLYNAKDIDALQIRKTNELKQRAFFGMIIEFEGHHSIGMVGFYEPQKENGGNKLNPFKKRYGVLSEENSILNVLDQYFSHYWDNAFKLREETKTPTE